VRAWCGVRARACTHMRVWLPALLTTNALRTPCTYCHMRAFVRNMHARTHTHTRTRTSPTLDFSPTHNCPARTHTRTYVRSVSDLKTALTGAIHCQECCPESIPLKLKV
jgi:hypothetical protein